MLLSVFDLVGTFVFASSGAFLARRSRLDLFGGFALALAAGTAGGVIATSSWSPPRRSL